MVVLTGQLAQNLHLIGEVPSILTLVCSFVNDVHDVLFFFLIDSKNFVSREKDW